MKYEIRTILLFIHVPRVHACEASPYTGGRFSGGATCCYSMLCSSASCHGSQSPPIVDQKRRRKDLCEGKGQVSRAAHREACQRTRSPRDVVLSLVPL